MYISINKHFLDSNYHGEEGDGPRCMVVDGHKVNEEHGATDEGREECSTAHHLLDPVRACSEHTCTCTHIKRGKGNAHLYVQCFSKPLRLFIL